MTRFRFISFFASLEIISNAYPVIEQMDRSRDEVNDLLRQRTTKKTSLPV